MQRFPRSSRAFAIAFGLSLVAVSIASTCSTTSARDLFVDNIAGNDRADGTTQAVVQPGIGPVRSLSRALYIADAGDRILMANTGTPYHESVCLQGMRNSGFYFKPFTIDGGGATLDGSSPVPADAWHFERGEMFEFQPLHVAYQQLFLDGVPAKRRPVASPLGGLPELGPREWALSG